MSKRNFNLTIRIDLRDSGAPQAKPLAATRAADTRPDQFAVGGYTRLFNGARYNPYTAIRGTPSQLLGGGGLALTF